MIELVDRFPDVDVQPAEYQRLLGFPRDRRLTGRARELANWARAWYAKNGRPWFYARQAKELELNNGSVLIDGVAFTSKRLQRTLEQAQAHSVVLVAVSAGKEIEQEAQIAWQQGKPDEYFFLEVFGSVVVEHLTTVAGARLCAWADGRQMAVLPHDSPGYAEWDIAEQASLLKLIGQSRKNEFPCRVEVLDSGMLRPKKSLLGVFGLTRHVERVRRLTELIPCETCSFPSCPYRRTPYVRPHTDSAVEMPAHTNGDAAATVPTCPPLDSAAKYAVNPKALQRWTSDRLSLVQNRDGTTDAVFRYDGTTCTNLGRPLAFHYHVKLGPRDAGYPIRNEKCNPAPNDEGYTHMCRYISDPEGLMLAIDRENPLLGRPLNDVLSWDRPTSNAGCYCEPADRTHKWRLVLETIHYALVQQEKQGTEESAQQATMP